MILIAFNTCLKLTFLKLWQVGIVTLALTLFVGCSWHYAIEQSRTQIADWISNPTLMLDTSVLLMLEVAWQMSYCLLAAHLLYSGRLKRRTLWLYRMLRWMPGVLILPVLFSCLVTLIFALPGVSFAAVAWSLAAAVFVLLPALMFGIRYLLPERELRLEILFLCNALAGIIGVVATVNGRTAVTAESDVDWLALVGVLGISLVGALAGALIYRRQKRRG
jgi:hypothetical protein